MNKCSCSHGPCPTLSSSWWDSFTYFKTFFVFECTSWAFQINPWTRQLTLLHHLTIFVMRKKIKNSWFLKKLKSESKSKRCDLLGNRNKARCPAFIQLCFGLASAFSILLCCSAYITMREQKETLPIRVTTRMAPPALHHSAMWIGISKCNFKHTNTHLLLKLADKPSCYRQTRMSDRQSAFYRRLYFLLRRFFVDLFTANK